MDQKDKDFLMWTMTVHPETMIEPENFGKNKDGSNRLLNNRELADIAFTNSVFSTDVNEYIQKLQPEDMTPEMVCASIRHLSEMVDRSDVMTSLNSSAIRNMTARPFHKKEDTAAGCDYFRLKEIREMLEEDDFDFAGATPFTTHVTETIKGEDGTTYVSKKKSKKKIVKIDLSNMKTEEL